MRKHLATNKHQELAMATEMSVNILKLFQALQYPIEAVT